jgi:hypothetical protein
MNTQDLARLDSCARNASSLSTALEATGAAKVDTENCCTVVSFLQDQASDDELLRVCAFLECRDLVRLSATCTRLCRLVQVFATDQVHGRRNDDIVTFSSGGQSRSVSLQYLRIQEQLQGIAPNDPVTVPIPVLLLPLRILVQDCGDDDYNGIYFCTGINGNGYIFSKPYRTLELPSSLSERDAMEGTTTASSHNNHHLPQSSTLRSTSTAGSSHSGHYRKPNLLPPWLETMDDSTGLTMGSALGSRTAGPCGSNAAAHRRLRCILAKNFSNEVHASFEWGKTFAFLVEIASPLFFSRRSLCSVLFNGDVACFYATLSFVN